MSVATRVSLEEFQSTPDPQGNFFDTHELHDGEIVEVPGPSGEHVDIQIRLEALLAKVVPAHYKVLREFYYTLPEQSRRADVAVILESRRQEQRRKVFFGAPDLVIEVLSESNAVADLSHLRRTCLGHECQEFWIVDPFYRIVEVFRRDGTWTEYGPEQSLKSRLDSEELELAVAAIFS